MKGRMGPLEQAANAALTSLAAQLGLALPPLKKVRARGDTVALTTAAGVTTGALTAPRTLLCELLRPTEPTLGLRLWRSTGLEDDVSAALQGDGRAHDDWLALARVVLEAGEQEAAQLLWQEADSLLTCEDPGDFFPRWQRCHAAPRRTSRAKLLRSSGARTTQALWLYSNATTTCRMVYRD